jgi:dTDP-4-amino-4,6-dideoxygalactose transaminase
VEAVGESYTAEDVIDIVKFLIQKEDDQYDRLLKNLEEDIKKLAQHGKPPGKLSLGDNVSKLEKKVQEFLGAKHCAFVTNATAGFEIGYKYANIEIESINE